MIIAVDGPAASGKGTLSRRLAQRFGLSHLDTGLTYRAVALAMMDAGRALEDIAAAMEVADGLDLSDLTDPRLKSPETGDGASRVATHSALRGVLVARQREFAEAAPGGAVLDGRDIGTVVCPDAALKLFVTAAVEERARRRALEVHGTADGQGYEQLLVSLKARDERDASRAASPLRPAPDAVVLDTTELSIDRAFQTAAGLVEKLTE